MRRPVIAGNWKMFKTISSAVEFVDELIPLLTRMECVDVIVAPTFVSLPAVAERARGSRLFVAAQDVAAIPGEGAFTGEVSAAMLVDAGATHVIIGHSERRQHFCETDESVNRKLRTALDVGLIPIVCVGETLEEREKGAEYEVVKRQILKAMEGLTASEVSRTISAYEPVWAIGTGRSASPETAGKMHRFLRDTVAEYAGTDVANTMRILYGGSAKPETVLDLVREPGIDGGLVGGASLDVALFMSIIELCESFHIGS